MSVPSAERICPLCERRTSEEICSADGVPTLETSIYAPASQSIGPGVVVAGRYRIERLLGEGGMGAVFAATQLAMNRMVALKVLRRDFTLSARHIKRFYQEARAASQLNHPNIVRIFDFGIDPGSRELFLAMELLEGQTLDKVIARRGMGERRAAILLAQVAKALVEAHEKGIVHRDLKPENIMVSRLPDGDEHVRVLDFGVAKILRATESGSESPPDQKDSITATGSTVGTPPYMSPEQVSGDKIDFRSDLYSLGCILHAMLSGKPPYSGERAVVMMRQISEPPPNPPSVLVDGSEPSAELCILHSALLEKPRLLRPQNTVVVARVLGALARGEKPDVMAMLAEARDGALGFTPPMIAAEPAEVEVAQTGSASLEVIEGPAVTRVPKRRARAAALIAIVAAIGGGAIAYFIPRHEAPVTAKQVEPEPVPLPVAEPAAQPDAEPAPPPPDAAADTVRAPPAKRLPQIKRTR